MLAAQMASNEQMAKAAAAGGGGHMGIADPNLIRQLEEEVGDMKLELEGLEARAKKWEHQLEIDTKKLETSEEALKEEDINANELRMHQQKAEFLDRELEINVQRVKDNTETIRKTLAGLSGAKVDIPSYINKAPPGDYYDRVKNKFIDMTRLLQRVDEKYKKLKKENSQMNKVDDHAIMAMSEGDSAAAVKMKTRFKRLIAELKKRDAMKKKYEETIGMFKKKDEHFKKLIKNWDQQVKRMEKAVILCKQVHLRDKNKFEEEFRAQQDQIAKLKQYHKKIQKMQSQQNRTMFGTSRNMAKQVGKGGAPQMTTTGGSLAGTQAQRPSRPQRASRGPRRTSRAKRGSRSSRG